jgi:Ca2+-binding RTX toxin-like protein
VYRLADFTGTASITGGAEVDTIALGSGNATISAGDGADVITLGAGNVNINFTDGTDDAAADVLIVTNGQLTSSDTVAGGTGSDIIRTSGAVTFADAAFTNITAVEIIDAATNDGALTATLGALAQAAGVVTINGGDAVDTINISAYSASATVTGAAGADSIVGGSAADSIDGGAGADTIRGGDGDDVLVGGTEADVFVFESTGAANDNDTITFVVADDTLNFAAFLAGGSLGSTVATLAGSNDVDITNKVVLLSSGTTDANTDGLIDAVDTVTEIAALIQGNGDALYITSGGKGVVIAGDATTGTALESLIYFVNDGLGANVGTIEADDVVLVGTLLNIDVDSLTLPSFSFD